MLSAEEIVWAQNAAQWQPQTKNKGGVDKAKREAARYLLRAVSQKLGITPSGTHGLRRLILSQIKKAKGIEAARQWAGHASIKTTEIYLTDLDLEDDLRATHGAIQKLRDKG